MWLTEKFSIFTFQNYNENYLNQGNLSFQNGMVFIEPQLSGVYEGDKEPTGEGGGCEYLHSSFYIFIFLCRTCGWNITKREIGSVKWNSRKVGVKYFARTASSCIVIYSAMRKLLLFFFLYCFLFPPFWWWGAEGDLLIQEQTLIEIR